MDRATRNKFASGTDQSDVTTGNACWQTAPAIYADLDSIFGFDIDLFADSQKALAPAWLGPGSELADDALEMWWPQFGNVGFCNPPYGKFISRVLPHAAAMADEGFTSVHLLPLRLTKAMRWAIFVSSNVAEWWFPDKRLVFYEDGKPRLDKHGRPTTALFDSTILVFRPGQHPTPLIREYKVPKHV